MKKSLLTVIAGFATLALMQGADTPTQPAAGTAAPDFSLATSDGSQVSLKDFKGKWVVQFCSKEGLTFKLLADPEGKVSAQYGSTMQYQGTTMAARNTFLINPEGKIAKVYSGVKPAEHSEQVLKDLAELKKS